MLLDFQFQHVPAFNWSARRSPGGNFRCTDPSQAARHFTLFFSPHEYVETVKLDCETSLYVSALSASWGCSTEFQKEACRIGINGAMQAMCLAYQHWHTSYLG